MFLSVLLILLLHKTEGGDWLCQALSVETTSQPRKSPVDCFDKLRLGAEGPRHL